MRHVQLTSPISMKKTRSDSPTKLITVLRKIVNETHETVHVQVCEKGKEAQQITLLPQSEAAFGEWIPHCTSMVEFEIYTKYLQIKLLSSHRYVRVWEHNGKIHYGTEWSATAKLVPGDADVGGYTNDKVLVVGPDGLGMRNYGDERAAATKPTKSAGEWSKIAPGKDEMTLRYSGYCRVYVRRNSAFGAGHTGFAFALPNGRWAVGAVENPKGMPIVSPGETGFWSLVCNAADVDAYFTNKHPMNYPYDAYKTIAVANANFYAAQAEIADWHQKPYELVGKNCMDTTIAVLTAFGAKLPPVKLRPNDWFNSIPGQIQPAYEIPSPEDAERGAFSPVPPEALKALAPSFAATKDAGRTIEVIQPGPVPASAETPMHRGWFHVMAMPIAAIPWPDARTTGAWSKVNLKGRMPKNTRLFLTLFTGVNTVLPRKAVVAALENQSNDARILEWIPIFSIVMKFLKFIGSALTAVANSWEEFAMWYGNMDSSGNPNSSDPDANKQHASEAARSPEQQTEARRIVPAELQPRVPVEAGSHAAPKAAKGFALLATKDNRLVARNMSRGLKVVFEYDDNTNYWLTIPDRARATVWSNRLEVPIEIPNAEKVRAVFVGWFEDFNDYQAGKVTAGDMFGVLDFWVPTSQVAATSKSGAKRR